MQWYEIKEVVQLDVRFIFMQREAPGRGRQRKGEKLFNTGEGSKD